MRSFFCTLLLAAAVAMPALAVNMPNGPRTAETYVVDSTIVNLPSSVAISSNVSSSVFSILGWPNGAVGVTSTQAGTLTVQRYLDAAGTLPLGAVITASLTANTAASVSWADGLPAQSIKITVSNSSASAAATISGVVVIVQGE